MFMRGPLLVASRRNATNAAGQIFFFILNYESREEIACSSFQSHHGFFRVRRKVSAVYARIALFIDQQYVIRIAARAFHSRRAMWHSRSSQAYCAGTLFQEPFDIRRGHVTFNRITVNQGGMA